MWMEVWFCIQSLIRTLGGVSLWRPDLTSVVVVVVLGDDESDCEEVIKYLRCCVDVWMWWCYAEGVGCRTSSIRARVVFPVLCRGGLYRQGAPLYLAGSVKGYLPPCLAKADPHHITKTTGLPEDHTAPPLVLGKRSLILVVKGAQ